MDDIAAAIESYCQAVRLDPSLHVCFANLATLYLYLEDFSKAEAQSIEIEWNRMESKGISCSSGANLEGFGAGADAQGLFGALEALRDSL